MEKIKYVLFLLLGLLSGVGALCQEMSVSTNVLGYADLGTLNVETSWGFARHWTATAGLRYNPFTFPGREGVADSMQARQRAASLGARYWPWHIHSGWWISGKAQWQEFNRGGIKSASTSEGDRVGGGLAGGYTYMLSPHINFEFGAGLWAGYEFYTTYACPTCGRIVDSGERMFFLPNDLILGLVYVF